VLGHLLRSERNADLHEGKVLLRRHGRIIRTMTVRMSWGLHPARWKALQEGTIDAAPDAKLIPSIHASKTLRNFRNLGESRITFRLAFTALIVDGRWAEKEPSSPIGAFLKGPDPVDAWMDDKANERHAPVDGRANQADGKYGRLSLTTCGEEETPAFFCFFFFFFFFSPTYPFRRRVRDKTGGAGCRGRLPQPPTRRGPGGAWPIVSDAGDVHRL